MYFFLTFICVAGSLLAGLSPASAADATPNQAQAADAQTWKRTSLSLRAQQQTITSANTGHSYRISVFVPAAPPPPNGYAVLYLLDGNASYPTAASLMQIADYGTFSSGITPGILVGIGYPIDGPFDFAARMEDGTPPLPADASSGDASGRKSGGAERFNAFIETELKPRIAAAFPIDPARQTLFGHSFGGLFALHTFFTHPANFQHYIAASPSIWWAHRYILQEKEAWLASRKPDSPSPSLFIGVGDLEQTPPADPRLADHAKLVAARRQIDNARELAAELGSIGYPVEFIQFQKAGHGASMTFSIVHAIRIAFGQ